MRKNAGGGVLHDRQDHLALSDRLEARRRRHGEVYLAHDENLERDVALKILVPGTLADESARRRFRKEALAVSRLNHPNIETVFDFGTEEGIDFLVMECISGRTLQEMLSSGPMPETDIAALGAQMADGLASAHAAGIVHRDLKPANLMVTSDGRLKILDFGVAKLLRTGLDTIATVTVTETGRVSGTLPYMAPEQLRGERVDARTDIHAAGAVLYEMATGRRPFQADTAPKLTDAILHDAPSRPCMLNPTVSPRLEEITFKCLEKAPENRYQSAVELGGDLRRLHSPASAAIRRRRPKRSVLVAAVLLGLFLATAAYIGRDLWLVRGNHIESIAVIPLANMSADPGQDYFADGMTETLITELSRIGSLKVISRTSVMRYKGTNRPLPEIGRELKVDGIIEGSVLRVGERVRISAQLIRASTDQHLWADSFDRDVRDVLALHTEVASAIARQVKATLSPGGQRPIRRVDPEAHEHYLKARFLMAKFTEQDVSKAISELEQALTRDPSDPLVRASLAFCHFYVAVPLNWQRPWQPDLAIAKTEALRAVELDDSLAEAHAVLAAVLLFKDWNWDGAGREYRRAIELDPNSSDAHGAYAVYLNCARMPDRAIREIERAIELDPMNLRTRSIFGEILYLARQYDRSRQELDRILDLDPQFERALGLKVWNYLRLNQIPQVLELMDKGLAPPEIAKAARDAYRAGGTEGYNRWYAAVNEQQLKNGHVRAYTLAKAYGPLQDRGRTLAYLRKAYQEHEDQMIFIHVQPEFDFLRSDPQFKELVGRIGIPQER